MFTVVARDAPGSGRSSDPPATFRLRVQTASSASSTDSAWGGPHVLGLSFGGGWRWSCTAGIRRSPRRWCWLMQDGTAPCEPRSLNNASKPLREADLPTEEWLPGYMPGMFSESAPQELIDEALSIMADVHLAGMRVGLRGFAEADLRDILPRIEVATLLLYGKLDQRSHCPWPRTSTLKSQGRDSWCCPESVT